MKSPSARHCGWSFQHLYLLGRSATSACIKVCRTRKSVSTPLPSGKVCDYLYHPHYYVMGAFVFQHLYLLGRSATTQGKSVSPGKSSSFNTFTFWEGLRPERSAIADLYRRICMFQHLYLLGRSATFLLPSSR